MWIGLMLAISGLASAQTRPDPLLTALKERLLTAEAVAKAKFNSGDPVEDKVRERQVIFRAVRLAVKTGVDVELTLRVFSAQIEASKAAQRAFIAQWQGRPPFDPAPNLATEVRPKLDALTPRIVEALGHFPYRSAKALKAGPSDPAYAEAWKIAVAPLLRHRMRA